MRKKRRTGVLSALILEILTLLAIVAVARPDLSLVTGWLPNRQSANGSPEQSAPPTFAPPLDAFANSSHSAGPTPVLPPTVGWMQRETYR